jgi:DNA-binding response OmpR family regulator
MSVYGCEYGSPTVLVVDDDTLVRETIRLLLEDHGFRVVTATDGDDGLRKFRQIAPDVVLADIIMPNKEGIAMIRELRRERSDARIIAMSGGGRMGLSDYATIATQLGADTAIHKPFDDLKLIDAVRDLLDRPSSAAQEAAA